MASEHLTLQCNNYTFLLKVNTRISFHEKHTPNTVKTLQGVTSVLVTFILCLGCLIGCIVWKEYVLRGEGQQEKGLSALCVHADHLVSNMR